MVTILIILTVTLVTVLAAVITVMQKNAIKTFFKKKKRENMKY